MSIVRLITGTCAGLALFITAPANAQDALGDGTQLGTGTGLNANLTTRRNLDGSFNKAGFGNALDANTLVGGSGWNRGSVGDPGGGFGWRNAIVTGNVAGGRGFRGSVGYTAAEDFRANTGSNDLFRFRADSAYSSPQFARLGSSFEQLRFGQDMAILEIPRAQVGASPNNLAPPSFQPAFMLAARTRIDRENMISSSSITNGTFGDPRVVGSAFDAQGRPLVLNASSTRGLTAEPPQFTPGLAGLSLFDSARIRDDVAAGRSTGGIGKPFETSFLNLRDETTRVEPELFAQPETPQSISDYDAVLRSIAERFAKMENVQFDAAPAQQKKLDDEYQELRRQLTGQPKPEDPDDEKKDKKEPADRPQAPPDFTGEEPAPTDEQTPPTDEFDIPKRREKDEDKPLPRVFSPDEFTAALRHGARIEKLTPEDQSRIEELMSRAEQRLHEGQYFLAERLFERALRFTPGHPLATVGAAHSQIGSGLYLAAASTLRNLLARQPELIDVMYGPNVLPSHDRLKENVATVQERLAGTRDLDSYGFMLAYLGHQLGDRALIAQGLDAMVAAAPDDELAPLLGAIWLAPADEKTEEDARPAPVEPGK